MARTKVVSAFTPSNTDPEILLRIFVQRHQLLANIIDRLARSMSTSDKHHELLIGPRGSGKTNFVTLARAALLKRPELTDVMRIAWLGEDDTIASLTDLALGIADQLVATYPEEFPADFRAEVRGLTGDSAAEAILNWVIAHLQTHNLLVIMENLDRAFAGLGDIGQKRWRAFLQETQRIALLATSQQLFEGIGDRHDAFWGFFKIHHLEPLTVEQSRELIAKISREQKKEDLITYLGSPDGRFRIRALHHLAGGNHRMYVLLAEFLTRTSLEELITAFEDLAEELTPYFQERIRSLSPQQARIIQCLCNAEGAITVKQVAEETFIPERNCSKQLGELKSKRFVQSEKRGKESFYEMAEPLMRLCLEVKNERGKPLRLIALFLRAWFPISQLQANDPTSIRLTSRVNAYRIAAVTMISGIDEHLKSQIQSELSRHLKENRFDEAMALVDEIACVDITSANTSKMKVLSERTFAKLNLHDLIGAISDATSLLAMPDVPSNMKAQMRMCRAYAHSQLNQTTEAIIDYTATIEMPGTGVLEQYWAPVLRGTALNQAGRQQEAIADFTSVIEMRDVSTNPKVAALLNRGGTFLQLAMHVEAIDDFTSIIHTQEIPDESKARALINRGYAFEHLERRTDAIADLNAVIEMTEIPAETKALALTNRGITLAKVERQIDAISDYSAVVAMDDISAEHKVRALNNRGNTLDEIGKQIEAISDFSSIVQMDNVSAEHRSRALHNRGIVFLKLERLSEAISDFTLTLESPAITSILRAQTLQLRGLAYNKLGLQEKQIADYLSVTEIGDVPANIKAQVYFELGVIYWHAYDFAKSQSCFQASINLLPLNRALFSLPEAMVPNSSETDVLKALEVAFNRGDAKDVDYGGTASGLLQMIIRYRQEESFEYAHNLTLLYHRYKVADKLASGLIKAIEEVDNGRYSLIQLDRWEQSWRRAAEGIEEFELPLRTLSAAIEAIRTKSDRPLFALPLEIRQIVRPMLNYSLGEGNNCSRS